MSTQTETTQEVLIPGGWTAYGPLTAEDKAVFEVAMKGFLGVNYTPDSVATQVVAGMNYKFKCTASLPGNSTLVWQAIVEIYKPLEGDPFITSIHRL